MKFLLSNIGSSKNMEAFKEAIAAEGHSWQIMNMSDLFRDDLDKTIPASYPDLLNEKCFYYGSISACDKVKKDKPEWIPFYHPEQMTCTYYYSEWKGLLVNQNFRYIRMQDIFNSKNNLFEIFGKQTHGITQDVREVTDNSIFIRPDANDKCFTGRVVFEHEFEKFKDYIELLDISVKPDTLCLVASPVVIDCEYRCFISHGKYITGSKYHQLNYVTGEIELDYAPVPQDVIDYANTVPAPCDELYPLYILDIARIISEEGQICPADELKVLEMGSIHCVGLYDNMDLNLFVRAIAEEMQ